jgi:hypothetical protein
MAFSRCQYVSDNGTTYQVKCRTDLAAVLGNTTEALGAHPHLPSSIKPRYRLGKDSAGREHRLVIGSATNALFVSSTTLATYPTPGAIATAETLSLAGAIAEKRYSR